MPNEAHKSPLTRDTIWKSYLEDLSYPSDKVTLADLRKKFPEDFTWKASVYERTNLMESLIGAVSCEREIAMRAACELAAIPFNSESSGYIVKNDLVYALSQCYKDIGLAAGEFETALLAEQIEKSAINAIRPLVQSFHQMPDK